MSRGVVLAFLLMLLFLFLARIGRISPHFVIKIHSIFARLHFCCVTQMLPSSRQLFTGWSGGACDLREP